MFYVVRLFNKYPSKWKLLHTNAKNLAKTLTGDRVQPLTEDTLTGRFLLYLGATTVPKECSDVDLNVLLKSLALEIVNYDATLMSSILTALDNRKFVHTKHEFNQFLHIVDRSCCNRVEEFSIEENLNLLNAFVRAYGHKINQIQYFHLALEKLMNQRLELAKDQLVPIIFYIGLLKKSPEAPKMLRNCLKLFSENYIQDLTKEDLCIICNSTFKTGTKIANLLLLNKIKSYINDNLSILSDPAIFVTFVKTLRHNRCQDDDILSTISCTMFFNRTLENYTFSALSHILALYADYLYFNEDVIREFTTKCLEQLKSMPYKARDSYLTEHPRGKDIKTFLWSLSNLNHKLSREDIENVIVPQVELRRKFGEFDKDPGTLVQILLYLWMMHYKASNLIENTLTKDVVDSIKANRLPSEKSLNLLLTCIHYEDPQLYQRLNLHPEENSKYDMKFQLNKRPILKKIVGNLKSIAIKNDIDKYKVDCQVPFINIIGITGYQKKIYKTVNIEVLDDYTCLKNTDRVPTGLMQLKLRLLDRTNEGLVVIDKSEVENCEDLELHDVLNDEISLVC
ncbi:hypothetical protein ABEB36_003148 [Hypothenemus hampei]|uniref:Uncharacterized protein n=1 Tax=Hypothenemus hampei TaxID=57062 RepID=A0ABD1FA19_HYPHA